MDNNETENRLAEYCLQSFLNQWPKINAETRQAVRKKAESRTARTAKDKRAKAAFLYLLDEAEKQQPDA